jgi:hypothetical protein
VSSDPKDRTQWLQDTNGTLSYSQALILSQGLSGLTKKAIVTQKAKYLTEATASLHFDVNGKTYLVDMSTSGQPLNLLHGVMATNAKLSATPYNGANAAVNAGEIIMVNDEYYTTSQNGVTGTTQPTFPACNFTHTSTVVDGTVEWTLLQFHTDLTDGNCIFLNVKSMLALYTKAFVGISALKSRLNSFIALMNEIASAPTSWASNANIVLNSFLVVNGVIYRATTALVPTSSVGNVGTTTPNFNSSIGGTTQDGNVTWTCLGSADVYIASQTY